FDPTAGVPLAGDTQVTTIGAGMLSGASNWAAGHPATLVAGVALPLATGVGWRVLAQLMRRRRRGAWGRLQDRFSSLAGVPGPVTNRQRAERCTPADDAAVAYEVARRLDEAAFDPTWHHDDRALADTRQLVIRLARRRR